MSVSNNSADNTDR